ncbi:MAG: hypothetical protein D3916_04965, partial [Candidatus Electrothrix sp. MAN1_4]|nr:hypothetical protein [Candidatus Electrothrix sp. MAN1_4]
PADGDSDGFPDTPVTDLQWWLDSSLPPGTTGTVTFEVQAGPTYNPPSPAVSDLIENTGGISFGTAEPFAEDDAVTYLTGDYSVSGQVFLDDGSGVDGIKGNGVRDGDEPREGPAASPGDEITVTLYYDKNGDGVLDPDDIKWAEKVSTAAAGYTFDNLPAKQFIVVVDENDDNLTSGVALTTDVEKVADIANAGGAGIAGDVTGVDFGFMPPLGLDKKLVGSGPIYEGREAVYEIVVQNQLPPEGRSPTPDTCEYEIWSTVEGANSASTANKQFSDRANLFKSTGPDGNYTSGVFTGGANQFITGSSFNVGVKPGNITKVEAIAQFYVDVSLADDEAHLTLVGVLPTATSVISNTELKAAVGESNTKTTTWDVTSAQTWDWNTLAASEIEIGLDKAGSADAGNIYIDALGYRITTDQPCEASPSTILNPVPLEDDYDETKLQFVSADPPATDDGDKLTWDNVGPIEAGESTTVSVTYKVIGDTDTTVDNTATATDAEFADGTAANTPVEDTESVDMKATGSLAGVVWTEGSGGSPGWQGTTGYEVVDNKIPGVTVNLYLCVENDPLYLGTGTPVFDPSSSKSCDGNGGTWELVQTQVTDSDGAYLFEGLIDDEAHTAPAYYYVEVDPATVAATITQTGDYEDQSGTCGVSCDNLAKDPTVKFNTGDAPFAVSAANEDYTDVNFGYDVNPVIFGNVWEDVDGDGTQDSGESGIPGNGSSYVKVDLYDCGVDTDCTGATVIASVYTDANGNYRFESGLIAGNTYQVSIDNASLALIAPSSSDSWTATAETDSTVNNAIQIDKIKGGVVSGSHDFGLHQKDSSTIGDTLFYDFDGNGIKDSEDVGIPDVTVYLYEDSNGDGVIDPDKDALVATDVTDATGSYSFPNLPAGKYIVKVDESDTDLPPVYTLTGDPDETGTCVTCDALGSSEVDGSSTDSGVPPTVDGVDNTVDFGYQPKGTGVIGDFVWKDLNGDGLQDGGQESGVSGVTVTLSWDPDGDGIYTTLATTITSDGTTDLDGDNVNDPVGSYLFNDLPLLEHTGGGDYEGKYRVVVDTGDADLPKDAFGNNYDASTATSHDVVLTSASPASLTNDFGFSPRGAIGNTVYWDADGNGDQDLNEEGIGDVTVTLYKDVNNNGVYDSGIDTFHKSTTTADGTGADPAGFYQFDNLLPNNTNDVSDYVIVVGSITGDPTLTADPDADGAVCPAAGTGAICDGAKGVNINPGTTFMGADFGYQPPGVIGDQLWIDANDNGVMDEGEVPLPGIEIELVHSGCIEGSTCTKKVTDSDGRYSFANLTAGTDYTVVVNTNTSDPNYPFPSDLTNTHDRDGDDNNRTTVTATSGTISDVDFGYQYANLVNSLSGTICLDDNAEDGICGTGDSGVKSGESPFSGVPVYIYKWTDGGNVGTVESGETALLKTTTTDSNGDYSFTNLPSLSGSEGYVVSTVAPGDYLQITTDPADTPADFIVINPSDPSKDTVAAYQGDKTGIGTTNTGYDFAYKYTVAFDYGDLPANYPTLRDDNGARHIVPATPNLYIGTAPDTEANGVPDAAAEGDDNAGTDDE